MMDGAERSVRLTDEQREISYPKECPLPFGHHLHALRNILADPVQSWAGDCLSACHQQTKVAFGNSEALGRTFVQEFCRWPFESARAALEPDESSRTRRLGYRFYLVDLLAGQGCAARNLEPAHASAARKRGVRDAELGATENIAGIEQLEAVAHVRAIGAEPLHRVRVSHSIESRWNVDARLLEQRRQHPLGQRDDVLDLDE